MIADRLLQAVRDRVERSHMLSASSRERIARSRRIIGEVRRLGLGRGARFDGSIVGRALAPGTPALGPWDFRAQQARIDSEVSRTLRRAERWRPIGGLRPSPTR